MRFFPLLLSPIAALFFTGCSAQSGDVVDVPTLKAELSKGDVQLIDVRTPQEWSTGHLEGATHIDWFSDDFKTQVSKLDMKRPVRLYCAVGGRSADARDLLRVLGFADVRDLEGGISAWKKGGGPVVK